MSAVSPSVAAPVAPASAGHPGAFAKAWNTPRKLRLGLVAIWAGALLLLASGETTMGRARHALKTIGEDAAPAIIAAQEISAALADLDANAANYLLGDPGSESPAAIQAFESQRARVTSRLVDAAENITYGNDERQPILAIFQNLGQYLELAGQSRYLHDHRRPVEALEAERRATDLMHAVILPAATALDRANRSYLDEVYTRQRAAADTSELVVGFTGFLLLALLVWLQWYLYRRMRRLLNPALLLATLATVVFTLYVVGRFRAVHEDLRLAKEDAFDSIHVLWQTRAAAYDANGDESRFLLDKQRSAEYERAFRLQVGSLSTRSDLAEVAKETAQRSGAITDWTGLFAQEVNNITFPGERAAAVDMVEQYASYLEIDNRVRQLETSGRHAEAVELATGSAAGQSSWAFDRFEKALVKTLDINKLEFERVIEEAERGLTSGETWDPVVMALIAILAYLGLRPRLREYRGG